jgi:hypothetical protein
MGLIAFFERDWQWNIGLLSDASLSSGSLGFFAYLPILSFVQNNNTSV